MKTKLEHALQLAAKGFFVFLLRKNEKLPRNKGWQDEATNDPDKIKKMWSGYNADCNIGIYTGKFGKDGKGFIGVLDQDDKPEKGKDGAASIGYLDYQGFDTPKTLTQTTASGSKHFIYSSDQPMCCSTGKLGEEVLNGIDFKSQGGLIVGAGSTIDGKLYTIDETPIAKIPLWLYERQSLLNRPKPKKLTAPVKINQENALARARKYIDEWAPSAEDGERNATAYLVACRMKDFGLNEAGCLQRMYEWNERLENPMEDDEVEKVTASAYKTGQNDIGVDAPEVVFAQSKVDTVAAEAPPWVHEMNKIHFVANDAGKVMIFSAKLDTTLKRFVLIASSFSDIHNLYKNEKVQVGEKLSPKGQAWTSHPKRLTYSGGIVFAPNKAVKPDQYNLWRGFGVIAIKGDWQLMQGHILNIICDGDKEKYNYVIGWMANAIQHPELVGLVALVLLGGQGTGKGIFVKHLGKLFGQHFLHISSADLITGRFNGHLRDGVLVFADEAFFAGDNKAKNRMKALITEDTFTLEDKFQKAQEVQNHLHFILASNEKHVVNVENDDRRHFILQVSEKVKGDTKYFEALAKEMKNGGLEAMLYDLLHFDLTNFNVRIVPKTEALMSQKLQSLTGPIAWLYNCLHMGEIANHDWTEQGVEVSRQFAHEDYAKKHRQYGDYYKAQDQSEFGTVLKEFFKESLTSKRPTSNEAYTTSRGRCYVFPPLSQARQRFEEYMKGKIEWPDTPDQEIDDVMS